MSTLNISETNKSVNCIYENKIINNDLTNLIINDINKKKWSNYFNLLKEYILEYNKLPLEEIIYKDYNLGKWCEDQRELYKDKKISLNKKKKLEEINGWWWISEYMSNDWEEKFQILKKYVKKYKKIPLQRIIYNNFALGTWCNTQRSTYKRNKLMKYKINKLEKINGWFWKLYSKWHITYKLVKNYIIENKNYLCKM